jgi:hypothetical protein
MSKTSVKLTQTKAKIGKCRMVFEIPFPNEEGEEREQAFAQIGRLMREALPTDEARAEFLNALDAERRKVFGV